MIISLLAVTLTAKACQPGTYGCGWNGQDAIVLVCDGQGSWDMAADCDAGQNCTQVNGVGYCV